ncbi:peptidase family M1-domain-containing protein [Hyaloraphidium curvatum]|nr:peptidase family M1-domain-containing protein [Hyaloraphidium curvatum]
MEAVERPDPNSASDTDAFVVIESHYDWLVDFDRRIVSGYVEHTVNVRADASELILDTAGLVVHGASILSGREGFLPIPFELLPPDPPYGRALKLSVTVPPKSLIKVRVDYETTAEGTALQWLSNEQTVGKKHPYLFTQCEAIHMRSLAPVQDTPLVKSAYTATVRVPAGMTALMSAVQDGEPTKETKDGRELSVWKWKQKVAIPAYLVALAVGNLASVDVSPRSRVWSEPEVVKAAAWEFEETEKFLAAGEELVGEYVWGRYDLLVLPGSFPYGGMENPCLTFVTPTLLAGDRSQVDVVAHEGAHSWTGNLVTNAGWGHFWLNEGFTVFLERKIVGRVYGAAEQQLSALLGLEALKADVDNMGETNEMTKLVKDLRGKDPDDAFSSVPYEKGFNFLYFLEQLLGGPEVFEPYLKHYIARFAYKSLTTDEWKADLFAYFADPKNPGAGPAATEKLENGVEWDAWFFGLGMPPVKNKFDDTLAKEADALAARWKEAMASAPADTAAAPAYYAGLFKPDDIADFNSAQRMRWLDQIGDAAPLPVVALDSLDAIYGMGRIKNSEVRFRWENACLKSSYEPVLPSVRDFLGLQGRMKYIRPLFRALNRYRPETARAWFAELRETYHPIAASLVAKDLGLAGKS